MAANCPVRGEWMKNKCLMLLALSSVSISIFYLVMTITYSPSDIKFQVTDAALTKFNLTNNNTLHYKLQANITSRNPNKNVIVYYRDITAIAWYKDHKFASVNLTPFDQGYKNTTVLHVLFEGKGMIKRLEPKQLFEYNQETRLRIYNDLAIDLELLVTYNYEYQSIESTMMKCRRLSVPLISNVIRRQHLLFMVENVEIGISFLFLDIRDQLHCANK